MGRRSKVDEFPLTIEQLDTVVRILQQLKEGHTLEAIALALLRPD